MTDIKRFAWYTTIAVVIAGSGLACLMAFGLLIAWMIENRWAVPFAACWVLAVFVAVGMSAVWGDV